MTSTRPSAASFTLSYRGQLLYNGVFDNKDGFLSIAQFSNSSTDPNEAAAQEKRAPSKSLDVTNSSSTLLTIPGSDNVEYRIEFDFRGRRIGKFGFFSAILEFMMTLAQWDSADPIERARRATSTDLSWIFVMHDPQSTIPLQGFQLAAILESIARHSGSSGRYMEMIFDFFVNGEFVAGGCVTVPEVSRAWCQGLRE